MKGSSKTSARVASCSTGRNSLPVNALIEMVFEMPEEISGQKNSNVVCQGRVMRAKDAAEGEEDARRPRERGAGGVDRRLQVHPLSKSARRDGPADSRRDASALLRAVCWRYVFRLATM